MGRLGFYALVSCLFVVILSSTYRSKCTTVSNDDGFDRLISCAALVVLDRIEYFQASRNLTKNAMFAVEVRRRSEAEEELRAVGVGAGVGHGEDAAAGVLVNEVLVSEGAAVVVDGCATSAIVVREVATLGHESSNDSVEG